MQEREGDRVLVVAGLGNPGRRYARTRHNVGFRVAHELAWRWNLGAWRQAFQAEVNLARPCRGGRERRVVLVSPQTYMNQSGSAVRQAADFYKVLPGDVLVVLDDMALPTGRLRARACGSAGGHKGLEDVLAAMGTPDVPRLRIGIGAPPQEMDATDYVLGEFAQQDETLMGDAVALAANAVEDWVFDGIEQVMRTYNPADKRGDDLQED